MSCLPNGDHAFDLGHLLIDLGQDCRSTLVGVWAHNAAVISYVIQGVSDGGGVAGVKKEECFMAERTWKYASIARRKNMIVEDAA